MTLRPQDRATLREVVASWPAEASSDAQGNQAANEREFFAPASHAAALAPTLPIVRGARGTGKSFWAGVLHDTSLRANAAKAYPRLELDKLNVRFGFTGLPGRFGVDKEKLDNCVPLDGTLDVARRFWWATVLRAVESAEDKNPRSWRDIMNTAADIEQRESLLDAYESSGKPRLLVVYDALDTVAVDWTRRRMLTQALFEVVWAMRAYARILPKLFIRPDQLDDDALGFVEMPKLRTGAVRLTWSRTDLYALLFVRLALGDAREAFEHLLEGLQLPKATNEQILSREWSVLYDEQVQRRLMSALAGPHMAAGPHGHKKGSTYDWPLNHLSDSFGEITPRSFLALLTAAAGKEPAPDEGIFKPDGIRHGLRLASRMRVDQLHLEFKWIKGVLAPLAGLLLPKAEADVAILWKKAGTLKAVMADAEQHGYLPPFPVDSQPKERDLIAALSSIGVMSRRPDDRVDMPDLFRVAAKLLKKGGTAPL